MRKLYRILDKGFKVQYICDFEEISQTPFGYEFFTGDKLVCFLTNNESFKIA